MVAGINHRLENDDVELLAVLTYGVEIVNDLLPLPRHGVCSSLLV